MRLLHPITIKHVPKLNLSHAWAEVFKFYASKKPHPKMFLEDFDMGAYMFYLHVYALQKEVNIDVDKLSHIQNELFHKGYKWAEKQSSSLSLNALEKYLIVLYPKEYLFSDCVSLYYKGINIFPFIYPNWRTIIPVESLSEIVRQITKAMQ